MKASVILFLAFFPMVLFAQKLNHKIPDPKKDRELLVGYCNREGFKTIQSNFDSAYQAEYHVYQPDKLILRQLSGNLKGVKITIIMGTWCGDSREWIPRFYKIMDQAGFNYRHLTLICVDRDKKAPVAELAELKPDRVPTYIFYRKKKEIGRIIEVPSGLLEKNMLDIVTATVPEKK